MSLRRAIRNARKASGYGLDIERTKPGDIFNVDRPGSKVRLADQAPIRREGVQLEDFDLQPAIAGED